MVRSKPPSFAQCLVFHQHQTTSALTQYSPTITHKATRIVVWVNGGICESRPTMSLFLNWFRPSITASTSIHMNVCHCVNLEKFSSTPRIGAHLQWTLQCLSFRHCHC